MKEGDYMFIEFGHNDQKLKGPGKGAYYSFASNLKYFVDVVRAKGGIPVFVTPTQRRSFDNSGKIQETHEDYPDAMRWVAQREGVQVIELHDMTRVFYEAMGVEPSKKLLCIIRQELIPIRRRLWLIIPISIHTERMKLLNV